MRDEVMVLDHNLLGERLWSRTKIDINPGEVTRKIPACLKKAHGVELQYGVKLFDVSLLRIATSTGPWESRKSSSVRDRISKPISVCLCRQWHNSLQIAEVLTAPKINLAPRSNLKLQASAGAL